MGNRLGNAESEWGTSSIPLDYSPEMCLNSVVNYEKWAKVSFYPFFSHQMESHETSSNLELLAEHGDVFNHDISKTKN